MTMCDISRRNARHQMQLTHLPFHIPNKDLHLLRRILSLAVAFPMNQSKVHAEFIGYRSCSDHAYE